MPPISTRRGWLTTFGFRFPAGPCPRLPGAVAPETTAMGVIHLTNRAMSEDDETVDVDDERMRPVMRSRWRGADRVDDRDVVVREEPLEIRVNGGSVAVVMRTPGHDLELARGFLVTERIVDRAADVVSVQHCTTVQIPEAEDNVVLARLAEGVPFDVARLRRNLFASSSCGICGKATIDAVVANAPDLDADLPTVRASVLRGLPGALHRSQTVFHRTGGLHAAGLFDREGAPLVVREDVGRHNAVDKVVGWAAGEGPGGDGAGNSPRDLSDMVLAVSGRISYEIAQKALAARIPVIAAVSAPTSLSIELASRAGIVLVGFVRGDTLCVYTHPDRVVP